MDAERWQRVNKLYDEAVELAGHERDAFLLQACSTDEDLCREVASLLAADDQAGSFIAGNAVEDQAKRIFTPADQTSSEDQPTAMPLNPLINQYRIVSMLGKGGMGEVWLAEDTRLKREVALKLLPAEFTNDADRLRRFEREALAISALNHPNIITIFEIGESEAGRFIVMELVEGRTLRAMMAEPVKLDSLIDLGSQLAKALHVAHAAGITHRDIKPDNIMVRKDGYVKVLDFGLAKLTVKREDFAEAESLSGNQPGALIGTVKYMSPEQAHGEKVTRATDIFALGILFYELATGVHPFNAATVLGTLHQITSETPVAPVQLNPDLPVALNALILRMLAKDALLRPTAVEVEKALSVSVKLEWESNRQQPTTHNPQIAIRHTVGREKERAGLQSGFASALNGRGQLLCIAGEPGIGKTTLVEDFLTGLTAKGQCTIGRGRCSERLAGTEAYLPLLGALESLAQSGGASANTGGTLRVMKQIAPTWYAQVTPLSGNDEESARLLTEIKPASQERMKRELGAFLQEVARRRPLVLFFDDLHWADVSTIDMLSFLAGKFDALNVLIVVTYRPTDMLLAKHPFLQIKPDLQARGVCRELQLEFLNEAEIAEYLKLEFPGHRFPAEFPTLIHAKTEGSPLFMADVVRDLRDRSVIAQTDGKWSLAQALPDIERDLPESSRAMIERKIAQLSGEDRKLLTAASVQGYEFDSAVVAQVLNLADDEIEERLEKLEHIYAFVKLTRDIEFPNRTLTQRYRFVHVLYQNVLYASLRTTRKVMMLSLKVAQTIEGFYGKQKASVANELATLYEAGREILKAASYVQIAAQQANEVFAIQEAAALAARGLKMLATLPDTTERDQQELALQLTLGAALRTSRGYVAPAVGKAYERARELCQRTSEPTKLVPILLGLWELNQVRADRETTLRFAEQLLTLAHGLDEPSYQFIAETVYADTLFWFGEFSAGRDHVE